MADVCQLRARLGGQRVVDDIDIIDGYRRDHSVLTSAGRAAVVRASSVDDVVAVMQIASASSTPVVTRVPVPAWPAAPMPSTAALCCPPRP